MEVGEERLAMYTNFYEIVLPQFLSHLQRLLGDKTYFVGDKLSLADVAVFNMFDILMFPPCEVVAADEKAKAQQARCLDSFPNLQALKARVEAEPGIKAWLA